MTELEILAPMIATITLILTAGGVMVFRPLTKRLGDLIELRMKQARGEIEDPKLDRMERMLESMSSRLALMEERQDFSEQLLRSRERSGPRQELPSATEESWE